MRAPEFPLSLGDISPAAVEEAAAAVSALIEQCRALLPPLMRLTPDQRRRSKGNLRKGEAPVLLQILDAAVAFPVLVASLEDKDGGSDPHRFEDERVRAALQRADVYERLAALFQGVADDLRDSALHERGQVRRVLQPVYQQAKAISATDASMSSRIAAVLTFYQAMGKAAAASRRANRATDG